MVSLSSEGFVPASDEVIGGLKRECKGKGKENENKPPKHETPHGAGLAGGVEGAIFSTSQRGAVSSALVG